MHAATVWLKPAWYGMVYTSYEEGVISAYYYPVDTYHINIDRTIDHLSSSFHQAYSWLNHNAILIHDTKIYEPLTGKQTLWPLTIPFLNRLAAVHVEVKVEAAVMIQYKISDEIGAL